ncbi:Arc family DNA-binding protein [Acinetobacter cumulans]|uniref:Arc family DNA-binding protein n=1 Tax=Acinetobacter cumulans TaxID=2136182 RepID=A0A498D531_9GAMM|nr:Arc family DNA-binding protein [Acinetobacter cumulans]RLL31763.1 Arc family DNA-binding protein [Acinetobacter cumulans]
MIDKVRTLNQEDWKRTQIRMPQEQYQTVVDYAEKNNLSLNSAVLELLDKALDSDSAVSVNDQSISKIADKVVERLKKAP